MELLRDSALEKDLGLQVTHMRSCFLHGSASCDSNYVAINATSPHKGWFETFSTAYGTYGPFQLWPFLMLEILQSLYMSRRKGNIVGDSGKDW